MTCRQCGYEWCWLCLKVWKGHTDYYNCNRYEKAIKKSSTKNKKYKFQLLEEEQENTRKQLNRYLEHYNRFEEFQALVSKDFQRVVKELVVEVQNQSTYNNAAQFIEKSAIALRNSTLLLKYSYAYKYFLLEGKFEKERRIHLASIQKPSKKKSKKKKKVVEEVIPEEIIPDIDERQFEIFIFTLNELEDNARKLAQILLDPHTNGDSKNAVISRVKMISQTELNILSLVDDGLHVQL